ncbi:MAG: hypothetical protein KZQ83_18325 [gamma proteobacterium symbiont of Taylorina sp.]|nr:hypothetical protein [gamma proteobacterium symbiont of Taylorina sp.]
MNENATSGQTRKSPVAIGTYSPLNTLNQVAWMMVESSITEQIGEVV